MFYCYSPLSLLFTKVSRGDRTRCWVVKGLSILPLNQPTHGDLTNGKASLAVLRTEVKRPWNPFGYSTFTTNPVPSFIKLIFEYQFFSSPLRQQIKNTSPKTLFQKLHKHFCKIFLSFFRSKTNEAKFFFSFRHVKRFRPFLQQKVFLSHSNSFANENSLSISTAVRAPKVLQKGSQEL